MSVQTVCAELRDLQRERSVVLKSRNMQTNRLRAVIAGTLGYHSRMPDAGRKKKFAEAAEHIGTVAETPDADCHGFDRIIKTTLVGIDAFDAIKKEYEKSMVRLAKQLPVASWVGEPEQRGFGLLFLAIVVGEAGGDLAFRGQYTWDEEKQADVPVGYPNPAKLWKRFGCAPHTFGGKTLMGATWKAGRQGKLPAEEWERFGYSPRRRSIAYLIGEGIVKQNGEGPYRRRYDESKAACKKSHPDYSDKRCHLHGMLLATKLLLKNLLVEWCSLEGVKLQSREFGSVNSPV